jgi:26S proteasome regulatory subunit N13
MYSDLLDQLGSSGGGVSSRRAAAAAVAEAPPLVHFKAGKIDLDYNGSSGTYACAPDPKRGEVRLVWSTNNNTLEWQWYDRREKKVVDAFPIAANNNNETASSLERIDNLIYPTGTTNTNPEDRIYVYTKAPGDYELYWMQDKNAEQDDELVARVNEYLTDPSSAAPPGTSLRAATSGNATTEGQVDALSSILENLGMPQTTRSLDSTTTATSGGQRTLTLADLQGAMAGIQQQPSSVSLADVVTPAATTALLQNDAACDRLIALLPPDQRTRAHLEENLRSPQVQQTLRSLTAAVASNGAEGFYSVLANFQLTPREDADVLANPIQAFLDAILKSVEEENEEDGGQEESKDE